MKEKKLTIISLINAFVLLCLLICSFFLNENTTLHIILRVFLLLQCIITFILFFVKFSKRKQ